MHPPGCSLVADPNECDDEMAGRLLRWEAFRSGAICARLKPNASTLLHKVYTRVSFQRHRLNVGAWSFMCAHKLIQLCIGKNVDEVAAANFALS